MNIVENGNRPDGAIATPFTGHFLVERYRRIRAPDDQARIYSSDIISEYARVSAVLPQTELELMGLEFWSEEEFQRRLEARAAELGEPLAKLLENTGLGHDTLRRAPAGRRIDTLSRIAVALNWTLGEVMGFPVRIDQQFSLEAYQAAERVLNRLPREARSDENRVWAHACIYDLLCARRRDGLLSADHRDLIRAYEEMLLANLDRGARTKVSKVGPRMPKPAT